jgi:hypothetical protein
MRTRLESFIELMKSNRENNPKFLNNYQEPPELAEIYDVPEKYYHIDNFAQNFLNPITYITKSIIQKMKKKDK